MKRLFLVSAALLLIRFSFASSNPEPKPVVNASEIMIPLANTGKTISLLELSRMSIKEVQAYSGQKMRFADRIAFKLAQMQLRKDINPDGTIKSNKIAKQFSKRSDITAGFHLGGFALGLLLSVIGVALAYLLFKDANREARIKWAWIGAAIGLVIWILIAVL